MIHSDRFARAAWLKIQVDPGALPLRSMSNPAWERLQASGFTLTEKLRDEIPKPHMVGFLFDSEAECLEVVKGLHAADYVLHEAMADMGRLFRWNAEHKSQFEVDRREDRWEPPKVSAVDAYQELLGMAPSTCLKGSVQVASQVSWKQQGRLGGSCTRTLPIVKVAQATSSPADIMRRAFGARRMKTLRLPSTLGRRRETTLEDGM